MSSIFVGNFSVRGGYLTGFKFVSYTVGESVEGPTMRAAKLLPSVGKFMKHLPNSYIGPPPSSPSLYWKCCEAPFKPFKRTVQENQNSPGNIGPSLYVRLTLRCLSAHTTDLNKALFCKISDPISFATAWKIKKKFANTFTFLFVLFCKIQAPA